MGAKINRRLQTKMTRYDRLWQALGAAQSPPPPGKEAAAVRALPAVGELPSPWVAWTLIGLVRHHRRQVWVGEVVTTRLGGDLETIARRGALGHPPHMPQSGLVPGLLEWEFFFHGIGCCLKHRVTGESIDVDFFGPTADYFDRFFYFDYLRSLRQPESPEERLITLHPSIESIQLAIAELIEDGLLVPLKKRSSHALRLSEEVLDHAGAIDAFCRLWELPARRFWLAALFGDWLAADEAVLASNQDELSGLTQSRRAKCRAMRCDDLIASRIDETLQRAALMALDDIDAGVLTEHLTRILRGEVSSVTSSAIDIIHRRDDPAWCAAVYGLLSRLSPDGPAPHSRLWIRCVEFLLRHRHHFDEIRGALSRAGGTEIGAAALLALEHAAGSVLPLFRRAIRSPIPVNRNAGAAVLALVDQPWSRQELLAVLRESDDEAATCECRAALRECHDPEAHRSVEAWEEKNHHEHEPARFITMKEMMLRHAPQWMQYEMEKVHDRVMRVRYQRPV